jgi:hypothetical protein
VRCARRGIARIDAAVNEFERLVKLEFFQDGI